jgi:formate dehydrogenase iron-sulfur subunit
MTSAVLVDLVRCMGCRSCQVACKAWNDHPGEITHCLGSYDNPASFSADTWSLIRFNEIDDAGKLYWVFNKLQCMHCENPGCVSVCPVGALEKTPEGPVIYDDQKCIACHRCQAACPFGVPSYAGQEKQGVMSKCTFCAERIAEGYEPACVKTCSTDALVFGDRAGLIAEGRRRISTRPEKYLNHIYGEKEAGGTSWMYISPVAFDKVGFPEV